MIIGLSLAVAAFGCDSDETNGGDGGSGGSAGSGGTAGDGGGGEGGGGPVDQCSAEELGAVEGGDPSTPLITECSTLAAGTVGDMEACTTQVNTCLQDGTDTNEGTSISEGCSGCIAESACCSLNECSILVGGPCAGPPEPGDDCDLCVIEKCAPRQAECMGDGSGGGGAGGDGGGGGTPTGNCDYGDCVDPGTQRDACETQLGICETLYPDMEGTLWDACVAGANLDACGTR
jgi:hypothetical protein